jgi:hypothetical protein
MSTEFRKELEQLINRHSLENGSNTPDYILAGYLHRCLLNFEKTLELRAAWYGRSDKPGQAVALNPAPAPASNPPKKD